MNKEIISQDESSVTRAIQAIDTIRAGGMVIMTDDEERENEGDLVLAASDVCPEKISFMAREGRGLICLSLEAKRIAELRLPMMRGPDHGTAPLETAFTVSIEARKGVTTGISAADRARTIQVAIDPASGPEDLVVPGHIFPLRARNGGVLERTGHTEGSVDLARLAGKHPSAVICEIMNDDGSMARKSELETFARRHQLPVLSIADLVTYRLLRETLIEEMVRKPYQSQYGTFTGIWFRNLVDQSVHFALINQQQFHPGQCVDVRVHKQDVLGDVFGDPGHHGNSRRALNYGLELLATKEHAALLYLCQTDPRRSMITALEGGSSGMDSRLYGIGAQIIRSLGIEKMTLHVRSPKNLRGLSGFGIDVCGMEILPE
ncbi:MAG: 3,4-dihydroxy-2-butanone-4-phosphate synthase [Deltaproteobacteria bacterium]|nr:3,4-dihydroxy-2-butanone-4-phosphate synthase [Deltaproteobacteria bacterium]